MKVVQWFALFVMIWCIASFASWVLADAGDLDSDFDGDGKSLTSFGANISLGLAIAIQPDGKIVMVGEGFIGSTIDFGLARYNPDGSLDTTFDSDGLTLTDFNNDIDIAYAVAIQQDGKILAAGRADTSGDSDFAIARYNSNGSLDTTFDGDGKVTLDFVSVSDEVQAMVIQSDGKIVVVGTANAGGFNQDFAVARYNSDGSLDTSFSFDGKLTTEFTGNGDFAFGVVIQPDGKILVAGTTQIAGSDFGVVRYNSDGTLDTSFDSDGKLTTDFASSIDIGTDILLQTDGKFVVFGSSNFSFALARYNSNGSLDSAFDTDGKTTTSFNNEEDFAGGAALQNDGKIVTVGFTFFEDDTCDFAMARFNTDGSLDGNFGSGGKVTTDFLGDRDEAQDVAIQPDGKIVVGGLVRAPSPIFFALARYQSDPLPPCIFCDDYQDGVLNPNWTYVKPLWTESAGTLMGTPTGKKAEAIASPIFVGCSLCNMQTSMQTAGGEQNKLWFLPWFLDKKNTIEVLMKQENGKWILRQRVGGVVVAKTKGLATILSNVSYNVLVTFDGTNFTLFVDGFSLATLPAVVAPNGSVGFRVKNTTGQFGFVLVN